jgi:hypothetical protein
MAKAVADDYLRRIPKAELHCHLAGTLRATTVAELAARAGLALPRPADKLYQWPDFYGFLDVLRLTALVLRTPEDFFRAVYEYVEDAVRDGNLRHVEFFFNPDYFYPNGIDYPAMVDGMIEGIEAAKKKFGVSSLLICCIDRSTNTPAQAVEIVETAIAHRRDHVVGIGLDGAERAGPPATFAEAYALAKRAGLHRTAHCCEDNQTLVEAPPTNYLIRHPDRSRAPRLRSGQAPRGAAEGPILLSHPQKQVPRLRRLSGGFARDDGEIGHSIATRARSSRPSTPISTSGWATRSPAPSRASSTACAWASPTSAPWRAWPPAPRWCSS